MTHIVFSSKKLNTFSLWDYNHISFLLKEYSYIVHIQADFFFFNSKLDFLDIWLVPRICTVHFFIKCQNIFFFKIFVTLSKFVMVQRIF